MNKRKMHILVILVILLLFIQFTAYGIGVSTAAFLPRDGSLSHPVSPLSIRDVGISMNRYLGISTSLSLYNVNGMGITDSSGAPLTFSSPPIGPFYTVLSSVGAQVSLPLGRLTIEPLAGVFGFLLINPTLRTGAIDTFISGELGYTTVDSLFAINGKSGWGYLFGGSITFMVNDTIGIQAGALYYLGGSDLELTGSYLADGSATELPVPAPLDAASMDFTGIEISIGVTYEM